MTKTDHDLRNALRRSSGVDLIPETDLDTLRGILTETFVRRHRFVSLVGIFKLVACSVFAMVALALMLQSETTRGQILWSAGFVSSIGAIGMLSCVHWQNMTRNALIREIKRVELRVAALAGAHSES